MSEVSVTLSYFVIKFACWTGDAVLVLLDEVRKSEVNVEPMVCRARARVVRCKPVLWLYLYSIPMPDGILKQPFQRLNNMHTSCYALRIACEHPRPDNLHAGMLPNTYLEAFGTSQNSPCRFKMGQLARFVSVCAFDNNSLLICSCSRAVRRTQDIIILTD
jgi:hypothetical protein